MSTKAESKDNNLKATVESIISCPVADYQQKDFIKSFRSYIMTARFTEKTYAENKRFRTYKPINDQNIYCAYNSSDEISKKVPKGITLYVLEMNNTTDKIMGIGKAINIPKKDKNYLYKVQQIGKHIRDMNRVNYDGDQHVDCSEMDEEDLQKIAIIEHMCFKGSGHLKRPIQITQFPARKLFQLKQLFDAHELIENIFRKKYG